MAPFLFNSSFLPRPLLNAEGFYGRRMAYLQKKSATSAKHPHGKQGGSFYENRRPPGRVSMKTLWPPPPRRFLRLHRYGGDPPRLYPTPDVPTSERNTFLFPFVIGTPLWTHLELSQWRRLQNNRILRDVDKYLYYAIIFSVRLFFEPRGEDMIGISVSFCIRDIVKGVTQLETVEKIIGGTSCRDSQAWDAVVASYRKTYWSFAPDRCEAIFRQLQEEGKIFQPRLTDNRTPKLATGKGIVHWVAAESEIQWC